MDRAYMEITKNFTDRLYKELWLEWGYTPGVETLDIPDVLDVLDGGDVVEGLGVPMPQSRAYSNWVGTRSVLSIAVILG
jgi:hypothetical protein